MDENEIQRKFAEMMGGEFLKEGADHMTGMVAQLYQSAINKGLPEQRAWDLAVKVIDQVFEFAKPIIQRGMEKGGF